MTYSLMAGPVFHHGCHLGHTTDLFEPRSYETGHREPCPGFKASVPAAARWSPEPLRAFVAEEIVAGEDVVDLEAVGAGEALADVALEEALAADEAAALAIREQTVVGRALAGLASR